jgi:hypothetical protein
VENTVGFDWMGWEFELEEVDGWLRGWLDFGFWGHMEMRKGYVQIVVT